jgi:hypothetical protein
MHVCMCVCVCVYVCMSVCRSSLSGPHLPPLAEASRGFLDHSLPLITFGTQDIARAALVLEDRAQLPSRFGILGCDSSDLVLRVQVRLACVERYLARDADHFVVEAGRLGD